MLLLKQEGIVLILSLIRLNHMSPQMFYLYSFCVTYLFYTSSIHFGCIYVHSYNQILLLLELHVAIIREICNCSRTVQSSLDTRGISWSKSTFSQESRVGQARQASRPAGHLGRPAGPAVFAALDSFS